MPVSTSFPSLLFLGTVGPSDKLRLKAGLNSVRFCWWLMHGENQSQAIDKKDVTHKSIREEAGNSRVLVNGLGILLWLASLEAAFVDLQRLDLRIQRRGGHA